MPLFSGPSAHDSHELCSDKWLTMVSAYTHGLQSVRKSAQVTLNCTQMYSHILQTVFYHDLGRVQKSLHTICADNSVDKYASISDLAILWRLQHFGLKSASVTSVQWLRSYALYKYFHEVPSALCTCILVSS